MAYTEVRTVRRGRDLRRAEWANSIVSRGSRRAGADDRSVAEAIVRLKPDVTTAFVAKRSLERRRPIRQSGRALGADLVAAFRGEQSHRGRVLRRPVSGEAGTNGR
jgi:hypothetical protein